MPSASRGRLIPAAPDLVFAGIALVLACGGAVRLTQSDGDLFAHIRLGEWMLERGAVVTRSQLGLTTTGLPMVEPAWLSDVLFAWAHRVSGLPFVAAGIALVLASAHAAGAWLVRRAGHDARWVLVTALAGVMMGASHWLARPHAFSLAGAALTVVLMEMRWRWTPLAVAVLFGLWANLHGGWVFGLAIVAAYVVGEQVEWWIGRDWATRSQLSSGRACCLAALAGTFATPYGAGLHLAVLSSLSDGAMVSALDEYAPPRGDVADLVFFAVLAASLVLMVCARRPAGMARTLVIVMAALAALRSGRNIALFAVTAWPLVALTTGTEVSAWLSRRRVMAAFAATDRVARAGPLALLVALVLLAVGRAGGRVGPVPVIASRVDGERFPVAAIAALRGAGVDDPLFTTWTWGGYLVYAWADRQAFIDPLRFTPEALADYGDVALTRPGWQARLDAWRVGVVLVPRGSALSAALSSGGEWQRWYEDDVAVVWRRRQALADAPLEVTAIEAVAVEHAVQGGAIDPRQAGGLRHVQP